MTDDGVDYPTWTDLAAAVGNLVFYWSRLELGLREAGERFVRDGRANPSSLRGSFSERLRRWADGVRTEDNAALVSSICDEAERLRQIRNLIVHGATAGDAGERHANSHIVCVVGGYDRPEGKQRVTLAEIEHATQGVNAVRRAFLDPSYFNWSRRH